MTPSGYTETVVSSSGNGAGRVGPPKGPIGTWVPADIGRRRDLSQFQRTLLARIRGLAENSGTCYASDEWFADELGCSEVYVRRTIAALRGMGLIQVTRAARRGRGMRGGRVRLIAPTLDVPRPNDTPVSPKRRPNDTRVSKALSTERYSGIAPSRPNDTPVSLDRRPNDTRVSQREESIENSKGREYSPPPSPEEKTSVPPAPPAPPPSGNGHALPGPAAEQLPAAAVMDRGRKGGCAAASRASGFSSAGSIVPVLAEVREPANRQSPASGAPLPPPPERKAASDTPERQDSAPTALTPEQQRAAAALEAIGVNHGSQSELARRYSLPQVEAAIVLGRLRRAKDLARFTVAALQGGWADESPPPKATSPRDQSTGDLARNRAKIEQIEAERSAPMTSERKAQLEAEEAEYQATRARFRLGGRV